MKKPSLKSGPAKILDAIDYFEKASENHMVTGREWIRKDQRKYWDELVSAGLIEPKTYWVLTADGKAAVSSAGD